MTPTKLVSTMSRIFRSARHNSLPPWIQDIPYRTFVSGHLIGKNKTYGKTNKPHCLRCEAQHMIVDESLEHAYHTCPDVAALWQQIIHKWNAATGQTLDHTDPRITLLGDRHTQQHAITEHLWRFVHAATHVTIHKERQQQQLNAQGLSQRLRTLTHHRIVKVKQQLQRLVTAAWIRRSHDNDSEAWHAWHSQKRVVQTSCGGVSTRVLEGGFHT